MPLKFLFIDTPKDLRASLDIVMAHKSVLGDPSPTFLSRPYILSSSTTRPMLEKNIRRGLSQAITSSQLAVALLEIHAFKMHRIAKGVIRTVN